MPDPTPTPATTPTGPEPQKVELTDAMREAIGGALMNGRPVTMTYVDGEGQPHMSLRGTVQVFGDEELAMWVRNPEGGVLRAIETNPRVAFLYRDPATRTSYQFHGRARKEQDAAVRDRVYLGSPELEQNMDSERRGAAVIVDVDRVEGREAGAPILMQRS